MSTAFGDTDAANAAPLPHPLLNVGQFMRVYERDIAAVEHLDGVTIILHSTPLFLSMYACTEALLSSQIEGIQSSLSHLPLLENYLAPAVELDDLTEVSNGVTATQHGISRIDGGFPLSLRLTRSRSGDIAAIQRSNASNSGLLAHGSTVSDSTAGTTAAHSRLPVGAGMP